MLSIIMALSACVTSMMPQANEDLRVMSFNIRYGTANDGENAWKNRSDLLIQTINQFQPDLLGTQETLAFQRNSLIEALPEFDYLAAGRDDGQEKGEMMALFYRKSRFKKLDGGHFWLSEKPDSIGSKSWDSSLPRMVTWVKLQDLKSTQAKPIVYFNTHFDHRGKVARLQSSQLLRRKASEIGSGCRVVISGDFNAAEGSEPYNALFAPNQNEINLVDTFRIKYPERKPGEGTFSGFKANSNQGERIDWIACSTDFKVNDAGIDRTNRDGRTASDHFAIFAILSSPTVIGESSQLRVLTYNIHHGEGMDGKIDLNRIAQLIKQLNPDLVALQEVDRNTKRCGGVDQTEELARLTGLYGAFGKAIDYSGGDYGQAILSRFPIENSQIHWLPGEPDRERRIAFEATITHYDKKLKFATTHLHHNNATFREQQSEVINQIYRESKIPVILAGDLNALPESKPLQILQNQWSIANTDTKGLSFPADKPVRLIDFILFEPQSLFQVTRQEVINEPVASDHRPVFVILEYRIMK
jgi:endonuclease/exonuclease/phosphatase family metal-dependent hydrolase